MADNSIVSSSKVTLSRNIKGYPFPSKLRDNRASVIAGSVYEAVRKSGDYELYKMAHVSASKAQSLCEQGLVSRELIGSSPYGSAIINADKSVSIMINEEDHVVAQGFSSGMDLSKAYEAVSAVDDLIAKKQSYCYHSKLGYLTACPASVGTGMHASVYMFLPGLVLTKSLQHASNAVSRLNMSLRSVYDESVGCYMYSLTNERTLGLSEKEIIDLTVSAVNHVIEAEERARKMLKISSEAEIRDKSMRSLALLKGAYKMSASEMMSLAAWVKLGAYYGFVTADCQKIDGITGQMLTAGVDELSGMEFKSAAERDVYRAELLRARL